MEAEELVAVGGTARGGGSGGCSDLDGVTAVLETLDSPTSVVDF